MENRIQRKRFQRSHQNQNKFSRVQVAQMHHCNSLKSLESNHYIDESIGRRVSELESFFIQERNQRHKLQQKLKSALRALAKHTQVQNKDNVLSIEKDYEFRQPNMKDRSVKDMEQSEIVSVVETQNKIKQRNNQENPQKSISLKTKDQESITRQMETAIENKIKQLLGQQYQSKLDLLSSVPAINTKLMELQKDLNNKIEFVNNQIRKQQVYTQELDGNIDRFRQVVFVQLQNLFNHVERTNSEISLKNEKYIIAEVGKVQDIVLKWKLTATNKTQMICQILEKQNKDIENLSMHYSLQQNIINNNITQTFEYVRNKMYSFQNERQKWKKQMKNSIKDIQFEKGIEHEDRDFIMKERVKEELRVKSQELRIILEKGIKQKWQKISSSIQLLIIRHIQTVERYLKSNEEKENKILNDYMTRYSQTNS